MDRSTETLIIRLRQRVAEQGQAIANLQAELTKARGLLASKEERPAVVVAPEEPEVSTVMEETKPILPEPTVVVEAVLPKPVVSKQLSKFAKKPKAVKESPIDA